MAQRSGIQIATIQNGTLLQAVPIEDLLEGDPETFFASLREMVGAASQAGTPQPAKPIGILVMGNPQEQEPPNDVQPEVARRAATQMVADATRAHHAPSMGALLYASRQVFERWVARVRALRTTLAPGGHEVPDLAYIGKVRLEDAQQRNRIEVERADVEAPSGAEPAILVHAAGDLAIDVISATTCRIRSTIRHRG